MTGLRKNAVINLPLPSGSSPPEKPPGMNIMLRSFNFFGENIYALGYVRCREVFDYHNFGICAGVNKRPCCIVFAVRSGEYGNQNPGLFDADFGRNARFCCKAVCVYSLFGSLNVAGKYGFKLVLVYFFGFSLRSIFFNAYLYGIIHGRFAEENRVIKLTGGLYNKRAVAVIIYLVRRESLVKSKAYFVPKQAFITPSAMLRKTE